MYITILILPVFISINYCKNISKDPPRVVGPQYPPTKGSISNFRMFLPYKLLIFVTCIIICYGNSIGRYYKLLGVDKNADDNSIKKSYRKLARKFHPGNNLLIIVYC